MKILAIDSSAGLSVALTQDSTLVAQITRTDHGVQGELTADFIHQMLMDANWSVADISDVVIGVGPGPYTGLRVGIVTAQVFAYARNLPIHAVCSLDALGYAAGRDCVAVTDARRKELYFAQYDGGKRIGQPAVSKPDALAKKFPTAHFVGPGVQLYPELINGESRQLQASDLSAAFAMGLAEPVALAPMYLRKPDADEPAPRKPVSL